ncbi:MAG TPA: hypothetical protein VK168_17475 [Saprospiraceae bacterium]|nr:hypothetical protein [Saprospiraceae bacterium]
MEDSQLVELIRTLTPEERVLARQLAKVDYFNSGKFKAYCPVLLEVLLQINDNPDNQIWDKEEISKKVFGQDTYVEGRLEKAMVEVHKVVKSVVQIQHYFSEGNEFEQQFDLAKIALKRGLEKRYVQSINKLQKQIPPIKISDRQNLYGHFLLEYELHDLDSLHNQLKGDLNVPNVLFSLELYLWLTRLELINRILLQQKVAKFEIPNIESVIRDCQSIPQKFLESANLIELNYAIFLLLIKKNIDSEDAQSLFNLIKKHENFIPSSNIRGLYTYLRNICVLIFNSDVQNKEINIILHVLYKDNLEKGYLHYGNMLHPATYLAVCNNAIWVNEVNWAMEFTEIYQNVIIDENETKDFFRLNMAACYFAQNEFNKCLDLIPDSFSAVIHHLVAKRLNLKALYETQSDLLPYRLDNFKMYLARTSSKILSDHQRQINTDFLNLLVQLSTSIPGDTKRAETLIKRIKEKKQAAEWRWLLEKAEELKNPRLKNKSE